MTLLSSAGVRVVLRQLRVDGDPDDPAFAEIEKHLDADAWHGVVTAGGLPLIFDGLVAAVDAGRRTSPPPLPRATVATQIRLLALYVTEAVKYCRCQDEEAVEGMVAMLVDRCGYSLGALLAPPLTDVDAPLMLLVSAFEDVLRLVSETQPSGEGAAAVKVIYRLEREPSAHCVGPLSMSDLHGRSVRLASIPALPRLLIDWSTWCASRAAAGHVASSRYQQLLILAGSAPVPLVRAVPDCIRRVMAGMGRLVRVRPCALTARHLFNLLNVLYSIAKNDLAGWRATGADGLRLLSSSLRVLQGAPDETARPVDTYTERLLLLASALASANVALGDEALSAWADASAGGLPLLIAAAETELPAEGDSYSMCPPAMLLHVVRALVSAGHPLSLAAPVAAASPLWRRLARGPDKPRARVAVMLNLLVSPLSVVGGGGNAAAATAAARGFAAAASPWAPAPYPPRGVPNLRREHACWTCGSHSRGGGASMLRSTLRKCGGCKVARFCSPACAATADAEGHRRECAGWAALREVDKGAASNAATVGAAAGAPPP